MHAVILAAGKNERLLGVVPPYTKPLVEIEGVTLIRHLVEVASTQCNRVVIVVSPHNVREIQSELADVDATIRFVIQPEPIGPGDALLRGVEACDDDKVLVICGDNVFTEIDLEKLTEAAIDRSAIAVKMVLDERKASQFTRITRQHKFVEGPVDDLPYGHVDGKYLVWLGPLITYRNALREVFHQAQDVYQYSRIGTHLNDIPGSWARVYMDVTDIGTPGDLAEAVSRGLHG